MAINNLGQSPPSLDFNTSAGLPSRNAIAEAVAARRNRSAEPSRNEGLLGDIGTSLKVGAFNVPGALTGLVDIPINLAGGQNYVSRAADAVGDITGLDFDGMAKRVAANEYSVARQEGRRAIQDAEGFGGTLGALARNPGTALTLATESLPAMAAGGALGAGAKAAGLVAGRVAAAATGEGAIIAGQQSQELAEAGVDPQRAATVATGVGIGGGLVGAFGAKLASSLGIRDIDVLLSGGGSARAANATASRLGVRVGAGILQEGALEELPQSVLETLGSNFAQEKPLDEGLSESAALGLVLGGVMGAAFNVFPTGQQGEPPPPDSDAPPTVDSDGGRTYVEIYQDWEIPDLVREFARTLNNEELAQKYEVVARENRLMQGAIQKTLQDRGVPMDILRESTAMKRYSDTYLELLKKQTRLRTTFQVDARAALQDEIARDQNILVALETQYPNLKAQLTQSNFNELMLTHRELVAKKDRASSNDDPAAIGALNDQLEITEKELAQLIRQNPGIKFTGDEARMKAAQRGKKAAAKVQAKKEGTADLPEGLQNAVAVGGLSKTATKTLRDNPEKFSKVADRAAEMSDAALVREEERNDEKASTSKRAAERNEAELVRNIYRAELNRRGADQPTPTVQATVELLPEEPAAEEPAAVEPAAVEEAPVAPAAVPAQPQTAVFGGTALPGQASQVPMSFDTSTPEGELARRIVEDPKYKDTAEKTQRTLIAIKQTDGPLAYQARKEFRRLIAQNDDGTYAVSDDALRDLVAKRTATVKADGEAVERSREVAFWRRHAAELAAEIRGLAQPQEQEAAPEETVPEQTFTLTAEDVRAGLDEAAIEQLYDSGQAVPTDDEAETLRKIALEALGNEYFPFIDGKYSDTMYEVARAGLRADPRTFLALKTAVQDGLVTELDETEAFLLDVMFSEMENTVRKDDIALYRATETRQDDPLGSMTDQEKTTMGREMARAQFLQDETAYYFRLATQRSGMEQKDIAKEINALFLERPFYGDRPITPTKRTREQMAGDLQLYLSRRAKHLGTMRGVKDWSQLIPVVAESEGPMLDFIRQVQDSSKPYYKQYVFEQTEQEAKDYADPVLAELRAVEPSAFTTEDELKAHYEKIAAIENWKSKWSSRAKKRYTQWQKFWLESPKDLQKRENKSTTLAEERVSLAAAQMAVAEITDNPRAAMELEDAIMREGAGDSDTQDAGESFALSNEELAVKIRDLTQALGGPLAAMDTDKITSGVRQRVMELSNLIDSLVSEQNYSRPAALQYVWLRSRLDALPQYEKLAAEATANAEAALRTQFRFNAESVSDPKSDAYKLKKLWESVTQSNPFSSEVPSLPSWNDLLEHGDLLLAFKKAAERVEKKGTKKKPNPTLEALTDVDIQLAVQPPGTASNLRQTKRTLAREFASFKTKILGRIRSTKRSGSAQYLAGMESTIKRLAKLVDEAGEFEKLRVTEQLGEEAGGSIEATISGLVKMAQEGLDTRLPLSEFKKEINYRALRFENQARKLKVALDTLANDAILKASALPEARLAEVRADTPTLKRIALQQAAVRQVAAPYHKRAERPSPGDNLSELRQLTQSIAEVREGIKQELAGLRRTARQPVDTESVAGPDNPVLSQDQAAQVVAAAERAEAAVDLPKIRVKPAQLTAAQTIDKMVSEGYSPTQIVEGMRELGLANYWIPVESGAEIAVANNGLPYKLQSTNGRWALYYAPNPENPVTAEDEVAAFSSREDADNYFNGLQSYNAVPYSTLFRKTEMQDKPKKLADLERQKAEVVKSTLKSVEADIKADWDAQGLTYSRAELVTEATKSVALSMPDTSALDEQILQVKEGLQVESERRAKVDRIPFREELALGSASTDRTGTKGKFDGPRPPKLYSLGYFYGAVTTGNFREDAQGRDPEVELILQNPKASAEQSNVTAYVTRVPIDEVERFIAQQGLTIKDYATETIDDATAAIKDAMTAKRSNPSRPSYHAPIIDTVNGTVSNYPVIQAVKNAQGPSTVPVVMVRKASDLSFKERLVVEETAQNTTDLRIQQAETYKSAPVAPFRSKAALDKFLRSLRQRGNIPRNARKLATVNTVPELRRALEKKGKPFERVNETTKGWYDGETIWLVADQLDENSVYGVLLHEMVHRTMSAEEAAALSNVVREWATGVKGGNSQEEIAAARAAQRVNDVLNAAPGPVAQQEIDHELAAYFVQEYVMLNGGLPQTSSKKIGGSYRALQNNAAADLTGADWMRALYAFIRRTFASLNLRQPTAFELTGEEIVSAVLYKDSTLRQPQNSLDALASFEASRAPRQSYYDAVLRKSPVAVRSAHNVLSRATRNFIQGFQFRHYFVRAHSWLYEAYRKNGVTPLERLDQTINDSQFEKQLIEQEAHRVLEPVGRWSETRRRAVANFLEKVTRSRQWPFEPDWEGAVNPDQVSPELAAEFRSNKFTNQERQVMREMFRVQDQTQTKLVQEQVRQIESNYAEIMASPALSNDEIAQLEADKQNAIKRVSSDEAPNRMAGYLPLRMRGKYMVVFKSRELLDAEENGDVSLARKLMDVTQSGDDHYFVQFEDDLSVLEEEKARLLRKASPDDYVSEVFERARYSERSSAVPYYMIQALQNEARRYGDLEGPDGKTSARVAGILQAINKVYVDMAAEDSIRKNELARKNTPGLDQDMFSNFSGHVNKVAGMIATIKTGNESQEALRDLKDASFKRGANSIERAEVYNEMIERLDIMMTRTEHPLSNKFMSLTSGWMLLTSPAYYMQNAMQPILYTLPMISAKFNDVPGTLRTMKDAYKQVGAAWKATNDGDITDLNTWLEGALFDLDKMQYSKADRRPGGKADRERQVFEEMMKRNQFDVGMSADLGGLALPTVSAAEARNGERITTKGQRLLARTHHKMIHAVRSVEVLNRGVTGLSAYRMHYAKNKNHEAALQFALQLNVDTQGDYSYANSPRFFRRIFGLNVPRPAVQFRSFQLIQMSILAQSARALFKGESTEAKAIGARQLMYILGMHGAIGGTLALPFAQWWVTGAIFGAMFGDEEEPDDIEFMLRRRLGNNVFADLVIEGFPSLLGVRATEKLGMGQGLIAPYLDLGDDYNAPLTLIGSMVAGPTGGLATQFYNGLGMVAEGQTMLGVAKMLPKGMRDSLNAYYRATEGLQSTNPQRDQLLSPEDISMWNTLTNITGWSSTKVSKSYTVRRWKRDLEDSLSSETSRLKGEWIRAFEDKDQGEMRDLRKQWRELQEARLSLGFKMQPMSNMTSAVQEQRKRELMTSESGVQYNRGNRAFVTGWD
jgi:hypothetical protein